MRRSLIITAAAGALLGLPVVLSEAGIGPDSNAPASVGAKSGSVGETAPVNTPSPPSVGESAGTTANGTARPGQRAASKATGAIDSSTSAAGGTAESTANGSLSTTTDIARATRPNRPADSESADKSNADAHVSGSAGVRGSAEAGGSR